MTQIICDICNRPLLSLADGTVNFVVTLCSKCAEEESLKDSSLLVESWEKFKVGTRKYVEYKEKTYICELMKAKYKYVNIKVTQKDNSRVFDYIVLIRNYTNNRIDFFRKTSRYTLGFVAREFLLGLLSTHQETMSSPSQETKSIFWEAIETIQGAGNQ